MAQNGSCEVPLPAAREAVWLFHCLLVQVDLVLWQGIDLDELDRFMPAEAACWNLIGEIDTHPVARHAEQRFFAKDVQVIGILEPGNSHGFQVHLSLLWLLTSSHDALRYVTQSVSRSSPGRLLLLIHASGIAS